MKVGFVARKNLNAKKFSWIYIMATLFTLKK